MNAGPTILIAMLCAMAAASNPPVRPPGSEGTPASTSGHAAANGAGTNDAPAFLPSVRVTWSRARTGEYRYRYVLRNASGSKNTIVSFALAPVPAPASIDPPPHWGSFYGMDGRDDALVFSVVENPAPADGDSSGEVPWTFDLQPGDSAIFVIVSDRHPARIRYFAQGSQPQPGDGESEKPDAPSLFDDSVTGSVIGPALRDETKRKGGAPLPSRTRPK